MFYAKEKPEIIKYRDYKNFNKTTKIVFKMETLIDLSLLQITYLNFMLL